MLNWHFLVVLLFFAVVVVRFSLNNIFPLASSYLCVVFFFVLCLLLRFLAVFRELVHPFVFSFTQLFLSFDQRFAIWPFLDVERASERVRVRVQRIEKRR